MDNKTTMSAPPARHLPVILIADASGSMIEDGKIEALNRAVPEMIRALAEDADAPAEIRVGVITFGGEAAGVHLPLTPVSVASWAPIEASGRTPLGLALDLTTEWLNDKQQIPGNAYHPTIVLLSDGQPTDEWRAPLKALLASPRGTKAVRLAVAIGPDADHSVLREFVTDPATGVLRVEQARQIHAFFRWLTMTVVTRTRTPTLLGAPLAIPTDFDDSDF